MVDIDRSARRCVMHVGGVVTVPDLKRAIEMKIEGGAWSYPTILDLSDALDAAVSFRDIQSLVAFMQSAVKRLGPRGPMAIVAPEDVVFGVARMYQTMADEHLPVVTHVARTMVDAEIWLSHVAP